MKLAIVGATGLVGSEIIRVLEERKLEKIKRVFFVATKKNKGKKIIFQKKTHNIISIEEAIKLKPEYVLFSAGSETSKKYAREFVKIGSTIIDNSSAFRMNKNIKLIVPEINKSILTKKDRIIANPNCSTIQLVLAIAPINKKQKIKRIIVSTYQAVVGTGRLALEQLINEEQNKKPKLRAYKEKIHRNIIPKCDEFIKNGYTKEEQKIIEETNKILNSKINITATAVRTPTIGGHGESVNIEFYNKIGVRKIINLLKKQEGIIIDEQNKYKTPQETRGKDSVFVSRVRKDNSVLHGINMWIMADPLRKGAATNAVQILEYIVNI